MFSAAIFDMDGLLIDSERAIMRAWQTAAAGIGRPLSEADYASVIGQAAQQVNVRLAGLLGGAAVLEQVRTAARAILRDELNFVFPAKSGAVALLSRLAELGVPCAVASSSAIQEVRHRLTSIAVARFFGAMAGGDEVPAGKPDPAVYRLAAARLGADPTQCLAFEDSENGVRAARAAGMQVVAVPDLVRPDASACLLQLASLDEAMPHVGRWFPRP